VPQNEVNEGILLDNG